jgi:hypothetical protein
MELLADQRSKEAVVHRFLKNIMAKQEPAPNWPVASMRFDQRGSRTMYRYANLDRYWCPIAATGALAFIAGIVVSPLWQ